MNESDARPHAVIRAKRKRSRGILWQDFSVAHRDSSFSLGMTEREGEMTKSTSDVGQVFNVVCFFEAQVANLRHIL